MTRLMSGDEVLHCHFESAVRCPTQPRVLPLQTKVRWWASDVDRSVILQAAFCCETQQKQQSFLRVWSKKWRSHSMVA